MMRWASEECFGSIGFVRAIVIKIVEIFNGKYYRMSENDRL